MLPENDAANASGVLWMKVTGSLMYSLVKYSVVLIRNGPTGVLYVRPTSPLSMRFLVSPAPPAHSERGESGGL